MLTIRIYVCMTKRKVTLSVDDGILNEARSAINASGLTLSSAFEGLLASFTSRGLEMLAKGIGVEIRYVGFEDVIRMRGEGGKSGETIRGMRDGRTRRLS